MYKVLKEINPKLDKLICYGSSPTENTKKDNYIFIKKLTTRSEFPNVTNYLPLPPSALVSCTPGNSLQKPPRWRCIWGFCIRVS